MRNNTSSLLRTALLAATMLPLGTMLVAQKVSTDYDHKVDFGRYHTFSIYKVQASNSLIQNRLRDDIVESLQEKGWQQVQQGGDVAVTAVGSVRDVQQYNTFYDGIGGGGFGFGGWRGRYGYGGWGGGGFGGDTQTTVQNIPVGNLVVDLYDTSTHQLVFRGMATDNLSSKPEKNVKKRERAVDKIFDKLPNKVG